MENVDNIPMSSSGRFYRKSGHKVAMIADEFFYHSFKDVADIVMLHPDNWYEQIQKSNLLLVVTTWRGLGDVWRGFADKGSIKRAIVFDIIEYCKDIGIPSVFYSKEDPPNYDIFIEIAPYCKYVYTSAEEMIPKYKRECGHDRVYSLMFCVNPLFHNPAGSRSAEKLSDVIFSGSWMEKYPERGKDLCMLFDGILASRRELKILDRNFALNNKNYFFPDKYMPYVFPGVSHEILQKVHKLYDWAININSVKESRTMFANRVVELQAAGNLLVSNYSAGVNLHAPFVYTVPDSYEVTQILDNLTSEKIQERQAAGIRYVMTGNTCFDRYAEICGRIGLPTVAQQRNIAVVVSKITENLQNQFEQQSYPDKELIKEEELLRRYEDFDMIAFFSDGAEYDIFYLEDMINGFKYTDSDYITKDSYYSGKELIQGAQHDFVQKFPTKFCTVFWAASFDAQMLLDMTEGQIKLANGYSIDCLHYNAELHIKQHIRREYKLSVIIPVYNNGLHLYGKAFNSLLRSSMFDDIEIILADDGSTDGITENYVKYIEKHHDNVKTFFYSNGGSGSASRARNKGVEMASADYIAFLDPENEAVSDGYARLYEIAVNDGYDLVAGDTTLFEKAEIKDDKKELMKRISFTPMKIQSMIIKKQVIINNNIRQITETGDDSLFSWQIMLNAENIKALNLTVHIGYETADLIGKNLFEKSLPLEQTRMKWLQEKELLADYMSIRFNDYFRDCYLVKFADCETDELVESAKIVTALFNIYRDYYNGEDKTINDFINYR